MPAEGKSPAELTEWGRSTAYARWAKADPDEESDRARRGVEKRYLNQVDPDGVLPERERYRRAEAAKHAHMADLRRRSAKARRLRAQSGRRGDASATG